MEGLPSYLEYYTFNNNFNIRDIILLIIQIIILYTLILSIIFILNKEKYNKDSFYYRRNKENEKDNICISILSIFLSIILFVICLIFYIVFIEKEKNIYEKYDITKMFITNIEYYYDKLFLLKFDLYNFINKKVLVEDYEILIKIVNNDYNKNLAITNFTLTFINSILFVIYIISIAYKTSDI